MATLETLLNKYLTDSITEDEQKELYEMLASGSYQGELSKYIDEKAGTLAGEDNQLMEISYQSLQEKIKAYEMGNPPAPVVPIKRFTISTVAAAAVIILPLSVGGYFYFNKKPEQQIVKTETKNDISPGGNKAILTLANGKQIILDSAANGTLTQQGNTKIIKLDSGQLAYQLATGNRQLPIEYNTISTPRGGQYQIVLADGSKVWLNAASSLRFPIAFAGKERTVELTGEGYFEISHNATKPFHVAVNGMDVQVLGTHFNINAYDDEAAIKTTLLQGSVKVSKNSISKIIKPAEQAILQSEDDKEIKIVDTDINKVMAWQRGLFEFNNTELPSIMRQISRWYDVDIVYETKPGSEKFGGGISKNLPLSNVLKLLEANGVQFRLEGKKLFVKP